jgi:uncharacterized membrane protein YhaH (DUF805 family)
LTFISAVKICFSKYATFSGRASRPEYWWFVLFVVIVSAVFGMIDRSIFGFDPMTQESNGFLAPLFSLAILLPMLAAGWRRMHDAGKPGWYLLLPMLFSFATMAVMMMGIMTFAGMGNAGVDPDALRGPAAFLGGAGMLMIWVTQLVLAILMLWWLTRPSVDGANAYGSPPEL